MNGPFFVTKKQWLWKIDSCPNNQVIPKLPRVLKKAWVILKRVLLENLYWAFHLLSQGKYVTRPEKLSLATFWETSICENLFPTQTFHQLHFEQGRLWNKCINSYKSSRTIRVIGHKKLACPTNYLKNKFVEGSLWSIWIRYILGKLSKTF